MLLQQGRRPVLEGGNKDGRVGEGGKGPLHTFWCKGCSDVVIVAALRVQQVLHTPETQRVCILHCGKRCFADACMPGFAIPDWEKREPRPDIISNA